MLCKKPAFVNKVSLVFSRTVVTTTWLLWYQYTIPLVLLFFKTYLAVQQSALSRPKILFNIVFWHQTWHDWSWKFSWGFKDQIEKKRKECFWISFKFCLIFSFMLLSVRKFYKNSLFFTSKKSLRLSGHLCTLVKCDFVLNFCCNPVAIEKYIRVEYWNRSQSLLSFDTYQTHWV